MERIRFYEAPVLLGRLSGRERFSIASEILHKEGSIDQPARAVRNLREQSDYASKSKPLVS
jgi:hypothetical protein